MTLPIGAAQAVDGAPLEYLNLAITDGVDKPLALNAPLQTWTADGEFEATVFISEDRLAGHPLIEEQLACLREKSPIEC
ncbi:hypothetical protein [Elongatibacter sediminis]|uniref:Uncharacterized protein n=1 Tax=Elongatibacter sediminis TaxID=3119006 RepID=A0AAW9R620_9GAMM